MLQFNTYDGKNGQIQCITLRHFACLTGFVRGITKSYKVLYFIEGLIFF